ncbi:olfactory receptor 18-like [Sorex araneus]|uniref:olfactory receptor 18-like n=1 Tax=Sorex araneus TaxID=42254 RepID=UPI002433A707|nr:olfactory receptor 18-like [Sorex araneus]
MYFFLSVLSLSDVGFTSTTIPKVIWDIHTRSKIISYAGCLSQLSLFSLFAFLDSVILLVMAYDRFVAICHPLHYSIIMNPRLCGRLFLASLSFCFVNAQLHWMILLPQTFCTHVEVPHFFCDLPQLIRLACGATSTDYLLMYLIGAVLGAVPATGILYSYTKIVYSILRISSTGGRSKAFSTCGSHLSVVCLFYGTGIGVYFSSTVFHSAKSVAVTSVGYTMFVPMLNPFIYSLRNKDIKRAFQKLLSRPV